MKKSVIIIDNDDITKVEDNGQVGYLYCLINDMYEKDMYKLGKTINKSQRKKSYTTSYLKDSKYIYTTKILENCNYAEKILFHILNEYRMTKRREFFKGDIDYFIDAIKYVENLNYEDMLILHQEIIKNKKLDIDIYEDESDIEIKKIYNSPNLIKKIIHSNKRKELDQLIVQFKTFELQKIQELSDKQLDQLIFNFNQDDNLTDELIDKYGKLFKEQLNRQYKNIDTSYLDKFKFIK